MQGGRRGQRGQSPKPGGGAAAGPGQGQPAQPEQPPPSTTDAQSRRTRAQRQTGGARSCPLPCPPQPPPARGGSLLRAMDRDGEAQRQSRVCAHPPGKEGQASPCPVLLAQGREGLAAPLPGPHPRSKFQTSSDCRLQALGAHEGASRPMDPVPGAQDPGCLLALPSTQHCVAHSRCSINASLTWPLGFRHWSSNRAEPTIVKKATLGF